MLQHAKFTGQKIVLDGTTPGRYDSNPFLNTLTYGVGFPDGEVREYAVNIIAENILSQVDLEGFSIIHLKSIVDLAKDDSVVNISSLYCTTKQFCRCMRHTICGWKLLV